MKTLFINMLLLFTATLSFAQVPNYVPTNGLVGWWPFNGNANDATTNGRNGTVYSALNTAQYVGGVDGSAIYLTGSGHSGSNGDYVTIPAVGFHNFVAYTISFWVKHDGNTGLGGGHGEDFFSCRRASDPCYSTIQMGFSGNNPNYEFGYGNGIIGVGPQQYNNDAGNWTMHTLIVNNGEAKGYKNGVLFQTFIGSNQLTLEESIIGIGTHWFCSGGPQSTRFIGGFDNLGIWSRALTDCEIADLYNLQIGLSSSTLTQSSCNNFTLNNQTYTQSGTYTQNLTNAAGCDSTITLNLTINNSPTASSSSTGATFHGATDGTVNLTVSGGATPYSFSWSNGANTEDLNAVAAGTYNVTITDANNCSSTTSVTVNQPPLALVKSPESIISSALYPNPATSQTRLDLQLNQAQDFEIAVYNNLGQRLFNKNYSNTKELNENIDMRSWPAGQYFVEIKLPNGTETKKLIKE